jgi:hypothetical protein
MGLESMPGSSPQASAQEKPVETGEKKPKWEKLPEEVREKLRLSLDALPTALEGIAEGRVNENNALLKDNLNVLEIAAGNLVAYEGGGEEADAILKPLNEVRQVLTEISRNGVTHFRQEELGRLAKELRGLAS